MVIFGRQLNGMRENSLNSWIEKLLDYAKMKIRGVEKTTLIDYPDKIACTIFLFGCNFRCGFCYNPELVIKDTNPEISEKEILNFLKKRKDKLEGVCITGGEPLLTLKSDFLKKIKELGYLIKLDTNGTFPDKLKELIKKELIDYIAMDIKSSKENYEKIIGTKTDLNKIEESIKIICNSNLDYEFRTTVVPNIHNKEEIKSLGIWINSLVKEKPKKYFLQGFKNMGKFINKKCKKEKNTSEKHLDDLRKTSKQYFKQIEIRV